jgi:hypothetical protein
MVSWNKRFSIVDSARSRQDFFYSGNDNATVEPEEVEAVVPGEGSELADKIEEAIREGADCLSSIAEYTGNKPYEVHQEMQKYNIPLPKIQMTDEEFYKSLREGRKQRNSGRGRKRTPSNISDEEITDVVDDESNGGYKRVEEHQTRPGPRPGKKAKTMELIRQEYNAGYETPEAIGGRLNISPNTVYNYSREMKIKLPCPKKKKQYLPTSD